VSRQGDQDEPVTEFDRIERMTVRLAYIADATPGDKINERWALLRAVYDAALRALREAVYPQHGNGVGDLRAAGITGYIEGSARVVYSMLQGGDTWHPSFIATLTFETTGEMLFQPTDLDRFETAAAEITEPDALEATEPVEATVEYDWS
jgi:hypothetical protein